MSNQTIEILGITPSSHFPECSQCTACTQVCETDLLTLPCSKPSMECILSVCVNVSICSSKIICTPLGKKLVIEAIKQIKVMYISAESCQSVHTAHFEIPFCLFILLDDPCSEVCDVCIVIEHISAKKIDCRSLSVSTIVFACPQLKQNPCQPKHHDHCPPKHHDPCHEMPPKPMDHCHNSCEPPCCPPPQPKPHHQVCPSCQKTPYGKNIFYGK